MGKAVSSEQNEKSKEVSQYGELIIKLVGERLSYSAIAARIETDHGIKLSRQRVHQIAQSLGVTSDANAMEKLRPLMSDLLAMRELGKTLDEINDRVLESVGLDISNSTLSRILARAEEEKALPAAPLSELVLAMKPRWTSVAIDYHVDQVMTLRAQGYSLKQVCAMLKAAHGITVEPSYLSHLLVKYGPEAEKRRKEAAPAKKADGTPIKTRNSRWKNITGTKSHEAATINRLRARRQVLDESLAPVQLTNPLPTRPQSTGPSSTGPSTTVSVPVATGPVSAAPVVDESVNTEGVKNGTGNEASGSDGAEERVIAQKTRSPRKPFSAKNFNTSDQVDPTLASAFDKFKPTT